MAVIGGLDSAGAEVTAVLINCCRAGGSVTWCAMQASRRVQPGRPVWLRMLVLRFLAGKLTEGAMSCGIRVRRVFDLDSVSGQPVRCQRRVLVTRTNGTENNHDRGGTR